MLQVVSDSTDIKRCQSLLAKKIQASLPNKTKVTIGYPSNSWEATINHNSKLWYHATIIEGTSPRYWNGFGFYSVTAKGASTSIAVEINVPIEGINGRVSGFFAIDDKDDSIHIFHRGRIGGGRKGIGKRSFIQWASSSLVEIRNGKRTERGILISKVESKNLIDDIEKFVQSVAAFKVFATTELEKKDEGISENDVNESSEGFDPSNSQDAKEKILRSIAIRRGQLSFRRKLLNAYDNKCAVTGTRLTSVLEAAHIVPYRGIKTNHVTNGLLLRTDIHTLFDLGLIGIGPDYRISIAQEISDSEYGRYHGQRITLPKKYNFRPSQDALCYRTTPKGINN